ncbi:flippase-like domain-containing protein [Patescibacteria group bacterium]|nr:flippase-like domain-containing protein [Patescibacteria group bacterium]MBU0964505.1 flippase-like domain-containing protein [Patescibacteria group bacterium]
MKKILLFILSVVVGAALFIGVIYHIGYDEIKNAFASFSWPVIFIIVGLSLFQMIVIIYRWQLVLRAQGDDIKFRKLLAPKFVGYAVSFLTPGLYVGGEPVRAYLLKKQAGVRLSHGMASIIVDKILDFTYPIPFLIAAMVYAVLKYEIPWEAVGVLAAVLLGLITALVLFFVQTYRGKGFFSALLHIFHLDRVGKIKPWLERFIYFESLIITFFNRRYKLFIKGLLLSFLGGLIIVAQFYIILNALDIPAGLWQMLVMMVFMILSFLLPIPGSLGSFETSQALVFNALKYPASVGVAFTLVFRVAEFVKVGIGLVFLSNVGLKFLREIPKNNNHEPSGPAS